MAAANKRNIFYAQSGGPTAVINATACGVIETARAQRDYFGKVYAGKNGILGALAEELIDTSKESAATIAALRHTPASAFGSCRYKLQSIENKRAEFERLIEVCAAHNIGYFLYNGGNDSQDTSHKIATVSQQLGYPMQCIGLPKTIDNDLVMTDNCPGFGSVAKYVAVATREAGLDVASMHASSTKVFILEVMGRHAGWIAAATGLANQTRDLPPHIILFPELAFNATAFINKVKQCVQRYGYCVIAASEGVRDSKGRFLTNSGTTDAFGHVQLGGMAPYLAALIKTKLGYKYHWAVADYLQRAAAHIASKTDNEQAYAIGRAGVLAARAGKNAVMMSIQRRASKKYTWQVGTVPLAKIANREKTVPRRFISKDGFGITQACRDYIEPLIIGESYPAYKGGIPQYAQLKNILVKKKLKA